MKTMLALALSALALHGAGCAASVPPPNDQWAAAQADVGRAESAGAANVPEAKLHLALAAEDLQKAKALIDKDNQRASTLTDLARSEAQLAVSLARGAGAVDAAARAQGDLQRVAP